MPSDCALRRDTCNIAGIRDTQQVLSLRNRLLIARRLWAAPITFALGGSIALHLCHCYEMIDNPLMAVHYCLTQSSL